MVDQIALPEETEEEVSYNAAFDAQVAKSEGAKPPEPLKAEPETLDATKDAPQDASVAQVVPPVAKDDEFLATLPEAARSRFAAAEERARKLDLDNRSLAGRMSAYQRRYEEAAGKRPVEVAKAATAAQTVEWTEFQKDYPDIAKAIESKYASSLPATATPEMKGVVEYVEQQKRERFLNDAWDAVEAVHPGWRDAGRTNEFQAWKKSSPTYEKLASSDDIADAIALFDLYDGHQAKTGHQPDAAGAAATASLAARREAQVAGGLSASTRSATPNTNVDVKDEDQLFAFYAAQSNARLQKRYK